MAGLANGARVKVGISLLTLVPGVVGGSETYARELTRALARVGELEYEAFVPSIAPDAADGLPTRVVREYRASAGTAGRVTAMSRAWLAPGRLRRALQLESLDAVHFPLSVMIPTPGKRPPAVVTVHDLQHELYPQFFSRAELAYRRVLYKQAVTSSRIVITISEHARETLLTTYGIDTDRVVAIPLGIDHQRLTPGEEPREPFLLYPANPWRHKNHARLYEAFALVRRDRPELRLVLTGTGHAAELPDGVESRGRVPYDELVHLYRTASALVFPSLYEGFGLPPLEAMACGCPVATSRATSLPEVCGDAAEYFDPLSPADMARAIAAVLDTPASYVERGIDRARMFTWETCARAHEDVYRRLGS